MPPPWVAVVTKPSAEEVAERGFRQCGYRVYLPRYRKLLSPHGKGRRQAAAMRPLFARTVFVQDWRGWPDWPVSGAVGLMMVRATVPARLSDADVALIMARERSGEFDEAAHARGAAAMRTDLRPGDAVVIEGLNIMATLEALSSDGSALVRALLFGGAVHVHVENGNALMRA